MSGLLGIVNQAAVIIVFGFITVIYHVPLSFGFAISALVGGAIGAGNIPKAKKICNIIFCYSITSMIIIVYILQFFFKRRSHEGLDCFKNDPF